MRPHVLRLERCLANPRGREADADAARPVQTVRKGMMLWGQWTGPRTPSEAPCATPAAVPGSLTCLLPWQGSRHSEGEGNQTEGGEARQRKTGSTKRRTH